MSLTELHAEVAGYREQANRLAEDFTDTHARVSADRNLTPAGKREQLEPLHAEVTEQISALHQREKAAVKGLKEKLERRVYGLSPSASTDPARIVGFRDATARARQLNDSDDALDLYESAKRSGDDVLAAAVMERAMVRGWTAVTDDYLSTRPSVRTDLDDLVALARYEDNRLAVTAQYAPPVLNLPHPAGFPRLGGQTTHAPAPGARELPAWMTGAE